MCQAKTLYCISWLDADKTSKFLEKDSCWVAFLGKFGSYRSQSFTVSRLTRQSTLVSPADATPGHLLSVVPVDQLALLDQRQRQQRTDQQYRTITKAEVVVPKSPPPPPELQQKVPPKPVPSLQPAIMAPRPSSPSTNDPRYTDAIRSQQQWLRQLQGR